MQKILADGLILRTLSEGYASDRERLPQLYADVNAEKSTEEGKNSIKRWTNDLISGHSTVTLDDIFVVVDPAQDDSLAAATLLIPQTWRYEEIPISVGRPELVGTYPEYRGRGLIRELFKAVHERSADLGHQLQVITGIEHFYRQFGYTMALDLGVRATLHLLLVPDLKPEYKPAFALRPATEKDIPQIDDWQDTMAQHRLVTVLRSAAEWNYEIFGRHPLSGQRMDFQIIVNAAGEGVGYLELFANLPHDEDDKHKIECSGYVVGDESSYLATFDDVIHGIKAWANAQYGYCPALLCLSTGIHDTLDRLIEYHDAGQIHPKDYLWYVRVPETIPFLRHIQPVLERRLQGSGANCYTGELKIGFYDLTGIRFQFEDGRITDISAISGKDGYDVSFPWDMFWNVVFGQHNYDELRLILPEVRANAKAAVLLDVLFPKKKSWLKGLA